MSTRAEQIAETLALLERHAQQCPLERIGLTPAQVRALIAKHPQQKPPAPQAQTAPSSIPLLKSGRTSISDELAREMYASYRRTKSLAATGKLFGRGSSSVWEAFQRRGFVTNKRGAAKRRHTDKKVARLYALYLRNRSITATARVARIDRTTLRDVFVARGLAIFGRAA